MLKKSFGQTKTGEQASLYVFENRNGMLMSVTDFGATLVNVVVPDRNGRLTDVVLGFDDVSGYEASDKFFGATVGRNANRIGGASFELNGKTYLLAKNDGENNLHSGLDFSNQRMWAVEETTENSIRLSLKSPHMDQGFPGNVTLYVTYMLTEENAVEISYEATPDADTILNMTNHSYFNLEGHDSGNVLRQHVQIDAEAFTRADATSVPTGEVVPVEGTPMDLRNPTLIGAGIDSDYEAVQLGHGYDHNWCLKYDGTFKKAAAMYAEGTGIGMEVYTDLPGMQFYTGNFVNNVFGKGGTIYHVRSGACFETQYYPDAIHKPHFQQPITKAGETYQTKTAYRFYL